MGANLSRLFLSSLVLLSSKRMRRNRSLKRCNGIVALKMFRPFEYAAEQHNTNHSPDLCLVCFTKDQSFCFGLTMSIFVLKHSNSFFICPVYKFPSPSLPPSLLQCFLHHDEYWHLLVSLTIPSLFLQSSLPFHYQLEDLHLFLPLTSCASISSTSPTDSYTTSSSPPTDNFTTSSSPSTGSSSSLFSFTLLTASPPLPLSLPTVPPARSLPLPVARRGLPHYQQLYQNFAFLQRQLYQLLHLQIL